MRLTGTYQDYESNAKIGIADHGILGRLILLGELSEQYIVVGTDESEFDYPSGDTNQYTKYEGTAGIKMNLFLG